MEKPNALSNICLIHSNTLLLQYQLINIQLRSFGMKMKSTNTQRKSVFLQMIEEKHAIAACVRERGDVKSLAKARGIQFAKPL